jgi:predicted O-methyltransferase YrrM
MNANELDKLVTERMRTFDLTPLMHHFEKVPDGQKAEVLDQTGRANRYYQWLGCLMKIIKPKQVIELGTSIGTSAIMMCTQLPKDAKLYTVDNGHDYGEGMKAFEAIKEDYPQLVKIWGDDLDLTIFDKVWCDMKNTDILFIDTEHKAEQLRKELDLYLPLLKKGTIVILDDIRLNDMGTVWDSLTYDKCENTNPCHYSGFGFFII